MTSATLFREGDDLDELLADLDDEHPGQVRVVEVTYDRDGGVLGFFARRKVGVHYVVDDPRVGSGKHLAGAGLGTARPAASAAARTSAGKSVTAGTMKAATASTTRTAAGRRARHADPAAAGREAALEDLLRAAEMVESGQAPEADLADTGAGDDGPNVEFARMLLEMAAQKAADRLANGEPAALPFQETVALATSAAEKFVAEPVAAETTAQFTSDAFADAYGADSFTAAAERAAAEPAPVVRSSSQVAAAKFATSQFTATSAGAAPIAAAPIAAEPIAAAPIAAEPVAAAPIAATPIVAEPVVEEVAVETPVAAAAPVAPTAPVAPVIAPAPPRAPLPPAPRLVSAPPRIAPIAPPAPPARPVVVRPPLAPTPPPARIAAPVAVAPIAIPVIVTPAVTTPAIATPAVTTPAIATPAIATPAVTTPAVTTPAVTTPAVTTPAVTTPTTRRGTVEPIAASSVISRLATAPRRAARRAAPEPEVATADQPRRRTGAHRAAPESGRSQFHVRRQLSEVGVPVSWIPDECGDAYWAIETLVTALPTAALPDPGLGEILVVVGTAAEALDAARQLCTRLRLDPSTIRTAGCPGESAELTHRWQAAALGSEIRSVRVAPAIVVVATDDRRVSDDGDDRWVASMVKALGPDHLWVVVDASRKANDCRALLSAVGPVDALWLTGAARTSSPASVWELDVPVAMLDGRPATRGAWAALLIDKLIALES